MSDQADEETQSTKQEAATPTEEHVKHEKTTEHKTKAQALRAKHSLDRLRNRLRQAARAYLARRRLAISATVVAALLLIAVVPYSRYTLLGFVVKQDVVVAVVDSRSSAPVSKAEVTIGGQHANTDAAGRVHLHVNVGYQTLTVAKQYYLTGRQSQLITLSGSDNRVTVKLMAIGRQVPVTVTNKLTGKPVAGAAVKALHAEAVTAKDGTATVVLPADAAKQQVIVQAPGYNSLTSELVVTDSQVSANVFAIVPAGKLYFLSNQSGNIDVVKTDLDGSNRQTVVAGTGHEDQRSTVLLASRDWKYLALYAQRKVTGSPELDLIDTSTDTLSNIDEGNASFTLVGWDGDRFIYRVSRNGVQYWQNGQSAIKSFDATTNRLTTLVETIATGGQYDAVYQYFGGVYIVDGKVVYTLGWDNANTYSYGAFNGKQATLNSVNPDGSGKAVIKSFSFEPYTLGYSLGLDARPYDGPNGLALSFNDEHSTTYYEYENGKVSVATDINGQNFYNDSYPTFLLSPSGKKTFWSVYADGKNNLKVGDEDAQGAKVIASESDYSPYGWFTDNYLLLQKSGSELYIEPSNGTSQLFKVTNYYKPQNTYPGYGGGYGGL